MSEQLIPNAKAVNIAAHRAATLKHLVAMAMLDSSYARWQAIDLQKGNPDWHGDLPERLDAELAKLGIKHRVPFMEPASQLPKAVRGPRGLPKHRFFHDSICA